MKTARLAGVVPEECEPLTNQVHQQGYVLPSGATLHWSVKAQKRTGASARVTLRFECLKGDCTFNAERVITLPVSWHCLGWIHGPDFGSQCFRSAAQCEAGRRRWKAGSRPTTDCDNQVGAAYCVKGTSDCFPSPWECSRETGGSIEAGTCVRTDR
jgi:hypothetical protein